MFTGKWCTQCKQMYPVMEELKTKLPNIEFEIVDIDENIEEPAKYRIRSLPSFVLVDDKGGVINMAVGNMTIKELAYFAEDKYV